MFCLFIIFPFLHCRESEYRRHAGHLLILELVAFILFAYGFAAVFPSSSDFFIGKQVISHFIRCPYSPKGHVSAPA
jgi:hypothetical protein